MTPIINSTEENQKQVIKKTIEVIKSGGLVVFPSDTVYGLLVDATNEDAVQKLITFKNRAPGKAISVFMADILMLSEYVDINKKLQLLEHLLPGPFTLILPSKHKVSDKLVSEKNALGVRLPQYPLIVELVKAYGCPITATSANLGGRHPHHSISSLLKQLPKKKQEFIDLIVDAGLLPRNKPSTVLDLTESQMKAVRVGDIVLQDSSTYKTKTATQTRKTGEFLIDRLMREHKGKPIVIVLQGNVGVGKTVLVKGIADHLGVDKVVSPTFVVYYEYDIPFEGGKSKAPNYQKFVHVDLYNIEESSEFDHLGIEAYMKPGTIMCIEWGEKLGDMYEKLATQAAVTTIEMAYEGELARTIVVKN